MEITKLRNHSWMKTLNAIAQKLILRGDSYNLWHENEDYIYISKVLMSADEVARCIDQLYYSIDMLAGYSSHSAMRRMGRAEYILFSIENYYLRYTSVFDRCLLVTNEVFQLKEAPPACNTKTIVKNNRVKATPVAQTLKSIDKITKGARNYRNSIAHRKSFSEEDIDVLRLIYHMDWEDKEEYVKATRKLKTDSYVKEKKTEFTIQVELLENCVEDFFTAVGQVFEQKSRLMNWH